MNQMKITRNHENLVMPTCLITVLSLIYRFESEFHLPDKCNYLVVITYTGHQYDSN